MAGADGYQKSLTPQTAGFPAVTVGTVVDTADPSQMGRLRVLCPALGDRPDCPVRDCPWAQYAAPFGGEVQVGHRGSDASEVSGPTAYGMWAIPKTGAQVLVMCLDGNPNRRVWIGCLYTQFTPHSLPHGRWSYNDSEDGGVVQDGEQKPAGPFNSFERTIEPLYSNLQDAFPKPPAGDINYEFASRAADFQAAGIKPSQIESSLSLSADDRNQATGIPGNLESVTQGYKTSQLDPADIIVEDSNTQEGQRTQTVIPNLDNMITAWVSPGFHAFSMDDRFENCRIRVRTTAGHQVIMDDTNERIYISTAKGNNWVEMDKEGNIDIYTSGKISAHAAKDINFTADGSFRISAKRGIHLQSDKEIRLQAAEDISVKSTKNVRVNAGTSLLVETSKNVSIKAANQLTFQAGADVNITAGDSLQASAGKVISFGATGNFIISSRSGSGNIKASGALLLQGAPLHFNGPSPLDPSSVTKASLAQAVDAFLTNRVPEHEPWGRTGTKADNTHEPLVIYESLDNGIRDTTTDADGTGREPDDKDRGPLWRR